MYNVFVNKKLLRIDNKSNSDFSLKVNYSGINQLESLILDLENDKLDSVIVITDDIKGVLADFNIIGEIRVASGGKVRNLKDEILFIKRNNVWDLPKGFVEKGESLEQGAIREVEEETGISGLKIIEKIKITYHTYRYHGKLVLKISHWYNMESDFEGVLTPQIEEGITDAKWLDEKEVVGALKNTWENIKLLF